MGSLPRFAGDSTIGVLSMLARTDVGGGGKCQEAAGGRSKGHAFAVVVTCEKGLASRFETRHKAFGVVGSQLTSCSEDLSSLSPKSCVADPSKGNGVRVPMLLFAAFNRRTKLIPGSGLEKPKVIPNRRLLRPQFHRFPYETFHPPPDGPV